MWFGKSEKELELVHQERMKCLEKGFPLPDAELAWVEAVRLRGSQVTAVFIVATVALVCGAVGSTAILLALGRDLFGAWLFPLLLLVWCVSGSLLYTLFRQGMQSLGQIKRPADFVVRPPAEAPANGLPAVPSEASQAAAPRGPSEGIQEGWYARQGTPDNT
jgi:hypothetical protein